MEINDIITLQIQPKNNAIRSLTAARGHNTQQQHRAMPTGAAWVGPDSFVYLFYERIPPRQTPRSFACVSGMFGAGKTDSQFVLLYKYYMYLSSSSNQKPRDGHRGHVRTAFRGTQIHHGGFTLKGRDWAGEANMTALSPWPRVEVMSLSAMNHSRSPEEPPGLFSEIIHYCVSQRRACI